MQTAGGIFIFFLRGKGAALQTRQDDGSICRRSIARNINRKQNRSYRLKAGTRINSALPRRVVIAITWTGKGRVPILSIRIRSPVYFSVFLLEVPVLLCLQCL